MFPVFHSLVGGSLHTPSSICSGTFPRKDSANVHRCALNGQFPERQCGSNPSFGNTAATETGRFPASEDSASGTLPVPEAGYKISISANIQTFQTNLALWDERAKAKRYFLLQSQR